jgi:hypothetical protein
MVTAGRRVTNTGVLVMMSPHSDRWRDIALRRGPALWRCRDALPGCRTDESCARCARGVRVA